MKYTADDLTTRAIAALKARGLAATVWRMGGGLTAAGLSSKHCPRGISLGIGQDASGETEACLFVDWEQPATRASARARLHAALFFRDLPIEDGGDDTLVVAGPLDDLVTAAVYFGAWADRPACPDCGRWTDDRGSCGACANCALPLCCHKTPAKAITECDRAAVVDLLRGIVQNYDPEVIAHVNALEILKRLGH